MKVVLILCALLTLTTDVNAQLRSSGGPEGGSPSTFAQADSTFITGMRTGSLFQSAGLGKAWHEQTSPSTSITAVAVDSSQSKFLVAGGRIYKSINEVWVQLTKGLDPTIDVKFLVCTKSFILIGGATSFISNDGGDNWIKVPSLVSLVDGALDQSGAVIAVSGQKVFRTQSGSQWTELAGPEFATMTSICAKADGFIVGTNGSGLFEWQNDNWNDITGDIPNTGIQDVQYRHSTGRILAASGQGVYVSENSGNSWKEGEGLNSKTVSQLIQIRPNTYVALVQDYGLYLSSDDGTTWSNWNSGLSGSIVHSSIRLTNGRMIAGTAHLGLWQFDRTAGWSLVNTSLPFRATTVALTRDSSSRLCAAAAQHGVIVSSDEGESWSMLSDGLPTSSFTCLKTSPQGDLFLGTTASGPFVLFKGKTAWKPVLGAPQGLVLDFAFSDTTYYTIVNSKLYQFDSSGNFTLLPLSNPSKVTSVDRLLFAGTSSGLQVSEDGYEWTKTAVMGHVSVLESDQSVVYAIADGEVFRSSDFSNWAKLGSSGLSLLALARDSDQLLVGSYGGGAYLIKLPASAVRSGSDVSISSYNFPNPFSDQTTIRFYQPSRDRVRFEVFDQFGKRVGLYLDDYVNEGLREIRLNTENWPAGCYTYRMERYGCPSFVRMMLVR